MWNRRQSGLTLVELIIAMVIIGAGLAGVLGALMRTSVFSASPMITKQLGAIAEGMMDEVLLQPFAVVGAPTPPDVRFNACARNTFNDMRDYHLYNVTGICDVDGVAAPGLENYSVSVTVLQSAAPMGGVPAANILEVTVTASLGTQNYTLRGWRAQ